MSPIRPSRIFCTPSCRATEERLWLPCCTMLVVLAGRGDNLFGLEDIVRARLLDVDILAGAAGVDGHQRVPVVGRGDGDGVDGLVFEQLAVIRVDRGLLLGDLLDVGRRGVQYLLVDIAERHQLDVGLAGDLFDVVFATAAQADGGNPDGVVRAAKNSGGGGCRGRGGDEKVSSVHKFRYRYSKATLSHSKDFNRGASRTGGGPSTASAAVKRGPTSISATLQLAGGVAPAP